MKLIFRVMRYWKFCTPSLLVALACLFAVTVVMSAQSPSNVEGPLQADHDTSHPHPLDNDTLIRMSKAGLGDDLLIQTIQLQPGRYDTTPDALIALKQAGLSDHVISTIQAHGTGLAIRANRGQSIETPLVTSTPPPLGVNEIGVYYRKPGGIWTPMETEIVHIKSGGFVKSTLTHGIIKEDRNGVVMGRESKLLLTRPVEFLIYAPDGISASEYELLAFRLNSKDREFRTLTGGVIHSTGGAQRDDVPFTPAKIAPRTWTFTLGKDTPGAEYGILPPGTGNVTNGGKIYTFAISE